MINDLTHDINRLLDRSPGPELLYKFRSTQDKNHRECLERGTLWMGEATALNDPFDSKPKEFLRLDTVDRVNAYKEAVRGLRVICFSGPFTGEADDILRWSHYADGHRGYCLLIRDADLLAKTQPVTYEPKYPDLADQTPSSPDFWRKVGFFKAECWRYENERRAVFPNGSRKEYILPKGAIWGVAFGCWSRSDERNEVAHQALKNSAHCYFFLAKIIKRSFSLKYCNITRECHRA